jgi:hypothetical protein
MVLPEAWRTEVAKGYNARALAQEMARRGMIIPDEEGKTSQPVRVLGYGLMRVYVLAPDIVGRDA